MKAHNLQSNFTFIKSLEISKELGSAKIKFSDMVFPKEIEFFYRVISFKKSADEFKIGYVTSGRNFLTEYKNGTQTTIKIKK
jgi:hypothetical protein